MIKSKRENEYLNSNQINLKGKIDQIEDLNEKDRDLKLKMNETLARQEVEIIHKLEVLYKERMENERKLQAICPFFLNEKCQYLPGQNCECAIFSLTCKQYGGFFEEVAVQ